MDTKSTPMDLSIYYIFYQPLEVTYAKQKCIKKHVNQLYINYYYYVFGENFSFYS